MKDSITVLFLFVTILAAINRSLLLLVEERERCRCENGQQEPPCTGSKLSCNVLSLTLMCKCNSMKSIKIST
eukprot:snap_masked-scaffold_25-processed-gene-3.22-mRNA-1 protein AED:1.00 eAED:1.00 QI:0/0/0/0/1/1/3/0/71